MAVQQGLANGDTSLNLTGTKNVGIRAQLETVDNQWKAYEADLQTAIELDTFAQESLDGVNEHVADLFVAAVDAVKAIEGSKISDADID